MDDGLLLLLMRRVGVQRSEFPTEPTDPVTNPEAEVVAECGTLFTNAPGLNASAAWPAKSKDNASVLNIMFVELLFVSDSVLLVVADKPVRQAGCWMMYNTATDIRYIGY